jgi:hypothetical protein
MKPTLLLLAALAAGSLTSCDMLGNDEKAWALSTQQFHLASEARHQAHAERMTAIARMGGDSYNPSK